MTILAIFRSRTHAFAFLSVLRAHGISARAVTTPKEAGISCGVSVRLGGGDLPLAKRLLASGGYTSFAGWMKYKTP